MDGRRVVDFAAALGGTVLLSPLLLGVGLVVWLKSGRPVLHVSQRAGVGGRPFRLYKFRSMMPGTPGQGPAVTVRGDPRITGVGRFLRKYKLDELPQLLNVLKGDMSLVGPRPEDPRYVARYTEEQRVVLTVRPGITSPASVSYRNEEEMLSGPDWEERYTSEFLPAKLQMEIDYLRRRSLASDLALVVRTLMVLVCGRKGERAAATRSYAAGR